MSELETLKARWNYLENIDNLNIENMDLVFVDLLNQFARSIQKILYINQGAARTGHSPRSKHYDRPAKAVDFYAQGLDLDRLFYFAHSFRSEEGHTFGAVGAYPFWNKPGLHIDMREDNVYWYRDKKGRYHYDRCPLDIEKKLSDIVDQQNMQIDFCDADF